MKYYIYYDDEGVIHSQGFGVLSEEFLEIEGQVPDIDMWYVDKGVLKEKVSFSLQVTKDKYCNIPNGTVAECISSQGINEATINDGFLSVVNYNSESYTLTFTHPRFIRMEIIA